ncbi:unnamed protein product, partial [Rotaria sp. Silwood2]
YYVKIFLDDDIYDKTTTFQDILEEIERCKQKQINGHDIDLISYVDILLSIMTRNQFIEPCYLLKIPSGLTVIRKDKSQSLQNDSFNIRIKASD